MLIPLFCLGLAQILTAAELPAPVKLCKNDATLNECVLKQAPTVIKAFVHGLPKLGIPSFVPLHIPKIVQTEGGSRSISMNLTLENIDIYGIDKAEMTKSEIDTSEKIFKLTFHVPLIKLVADYDLNGKFLLVPVTGKGKATVIVDDALGIFTHKYELVKKNGVEYASYVPPSDLTLKPKKITFSFENLFNGDKALGEATNKILNENWEEFFNQVGKGVCQAISEMFSLILNKLSEKYSYSELLIQ